MSFKKKCFDCGKTLNNPSEYLPTSDIKLMGGGKRKKRRKVNICNECIKKGAAVPAVPEN